MDTANCSDDSLDQADEGADGRGEDIYSGGCYGHGGAECTADTANFAYGATDGVYHAHDGVFGYVERGSRDLTSCLYRISERLGFVVGED